MIKPEDLKPIDNIIAGAYWFDDNVLKPDLSMAFAYIADNSFKYNRYSDKTDFNDLDKFFSIVLKTALSGTKLYIKGQYHFGYDRYLYRKGHPWNEGMRKDRYLAAIGWQKIKGLLEFYGGNSCQDLIIMPYDDGALPYFSTLVWKAERSESILNRI